MQVKQIFTKSSLRNFSYLIELNKGEWICIDPFDAEQILQELAQDKLISIINTHEHWDHICGNKDLEKKSGAAIWGHHQAQKLIPGISRLLSPQEIIESKKEGDYLQVIDTPGHTFHHLSLVLFENFKPQCIFTGDTLFNAGVGNCHNGGNVEVLFETVINKYLPLEDSILLYPGHEYLENNLNFSLSVDPDNHDAKKLLNESEMKDKNEFIVTNLGLEKKINPFLNLDKFLQNGLLVNKVDTQKEVFVELRKLRDTW